MLELNVALVTLVLVMRLPREVEECCPLRCGPPFESDSRLPDDFWCVCVVLHRMLGPSRDPLCPPWCIRTVEFVAMCMVIWLRWERVLVGAALRGLPEPLTMEEPVRP